MPQAEAGVRKVFGDMYFLELTAREGSEEAPAEKAEPEDLPFAVDSEFKDGTGCEENVLCFFCRTPCSFDNV